MSGSKDDSGGMAFLDTRMNRWVTIYLPILLFLFVLGSGLQTLSAASTGGVDLKTFIFPGVLCVGVLFPAMISAASLVWDRELGFLQEMLIAPVSRTRSRKGSVRISIVSASCLGRSRASGSGSADIDFMHPLIRVKCAADYRSAEESGSCVPRTT